MEFDAEKLNELLTEVDRSKEFSLIISGLAESLLEDALRDILYGLNLLDKEEYAPHIFSRMRKQIKSLDRLLDIVQIANPGRR